MIKLACLTFLIVQMLPAGTVNFSGVFQNSGPMCIAPADTDPALGVECTGLGTSTLSWGNSVPFGTGPNSFMFSPQPYQNPLMFTDFVVGTLFYYNGTTASNSSIDTVDLVITSMSTDPLFNQTLRIPITIIRTPNLGIDPYADSDFLYFTEHPEFGSFRVFEGQGTSVQIKTQFDDLMLSGFGDVSNPAVGFVVPSITAAIPEPATFALFSGTLIVGVAARKRFRSLGRFNWERLR